MGTTPHFWANAFEQNSEFGGLGAPSDWIWRQNDDEVIFKGAPGENTTLAIVATNAKLTKPEAHRLAIMAQTGLSRALHPVHTPLDGDIVFAASTGEIPLDDPIVDLTYLGASASEALARAVARGVYEATPAPEYWLGPPAYATRFTDTIDRSSAS